MGLDERGWGSFRVREAGPLAPPVTFIMRPPAPVIITAVYGLKSGEAGMLGSPESSPQM